MKKILGLDLGTNSIGWAVVNANKGENDSSYIPVGIDSAGSRIIPMDAAQLGDFEKGNSISQTKERTSFRSARRLRERNLLRRERLHRVLDLMGFLPEHYAQKLDRYGKFTDESEPKLAWKKDDSGKYVFLFKDSFNEMLSDFREQQPQLIAKGKKVPYDWCIYYLRKKALTQIISKEELSWLLLNFNQKRGYYQLRGEEEEDRKDQLVEFYALKVISVENSGEKKKDDIWYNVYLENGWIYKRSSKYPLDWVGKTKEFIVTTDLNADGTPKKDKDGNIKRSFRAPKEDDWTLVKKKTELDIDNYIKTSNQTVGAYIYDSLLQNPSQKIKGKLVRTIERKYYKNELRLILEKQKEFHPELNDRELYSKCLNELYAINETHKKNIGSRDFTYLFLDDIIFYQRPLKSKKSLIGNCPYECRFDKEGKKYSIKCIAKSNPIYQEFRLWQFISNLRIFQREKEVNDKFETDVDVTENFLKSEDDVIAMFDWLNDKKEIDQKSFFKYPKFGLKKSIENYRWNYVEDRSYPGNETRAIILARLKKANINAKILTKEFEYSLWHILYSVEDKIEIEKALRSFATKHQLSSLDSFVDAFKKCPPFKKEYGAYSEKAIKKLLSLMRRGKYWDEKAIDANTRQRIEKIITGEYDEKIRNRVREKAIALSNINQFSGLPVWLACYIIYDRHSEAEEVEKWASPNDIDTYLMHFKQHSLRNPIVEQIITETLRTVRDIWKQVGQIDEIHVELGRDLKKTKDERIKISEQIAENENANLRIKAMLAEFIEPEFEIENVRPYSPSQQDILRIYEEGALNSNEIPDDIQSILDKFKQTDERKRPTRNEFVRYKLWLNQKYRSPYTGKQIPLGKLFTSAYEIEHIIPQSRYFDDSFSNKVICEAEVNKLKDNQLGYEFITAHHGEKVQLTGGEVVEVLSIDAYETLVKNDYGQNRPKMSKLLMSDIPDKFIERQLNDSRYISKIVKTLLSNIVREKEENGEYEQEATSKNVISCNGSITSRLKKDWGMNDVWNKIILPRFERLNKLTGRNVFTTESNGHIIPSMPLELEKGFNKKRIDHRHHAMDAIVIACATRSHVNLLNNESALSENKANRYQLSHKLRRYEKVMINGQERSVPREFILPWKTFPQDAYSVLNGIVVSFKQNLRIINKTTNHYQHYNDEGKKVFVKQEKGDSWAIRKSMHNKTFWAKVHIRKIKETSLTEVLKKPQSIVEKKLKEKIKELILIGYDEKSIKKYFDENKNVWANIDINKIKSYYYEDDSATRFMADLVTYFSDVKKIEKALNKIDRITDVNIQKILKNHLRASGNNPEVAFSADGIDKMNLNIIALNDGVYHCPIYKVRRYECIGKKFAVGKNGSKKDKYVEASGGTNLYFAVYQTRTIDKETGMEKTTRSYATVPLNIAIECQKTAGKNWKTELDSVLKTEKYVTKDATLLFVLSPNDLVYLPTNEESKSGQIRNPLNKSRIYKMVDSSDTTANFIPNSVASLIYSLPKLIAEIFCNEMVVQNEFGIGSPQSKNQRAITGEMIKETCLPVKIDRLGNIEII